MKIYHEKSNKKTQTTINYKQLSVLRKNMRETDFSTSDAHKGGDWGVTVMQSYVLFSYCLG